MESTTIPPTDNKNGEENHEMPGPEHFIPLEVLNDNAHSKSVTILGYMKSKSCNQEEKSKKALILLNKSPFTESTAFDLLTCDLTHHKPNLINDLYRKYISQSQPKFNGINTTLIYPATDRHITKYRRQAVITFSETSKLYNEYVKPFLADYQFSVEWVYNILEGKQEVDRIIYRDDDFLLLPDLKWSGEQIEDLYIIALPIRRDIGSIRDLNASHLSLLRTILNKGKAEIEKHYSLEKNKLRVYLHYQPSYYHLHVHFTHVRFLSPGFNADKAHLLPNIIDNIERNGSYYQECLLSYTLKEESELYLFLNDQELI